MPAEARIAGVVLGAGGSRRFGEPNKLIACLDGRPLIVRVVDALAAAGIAPLVVVTGWDHEGVARSLSNPDVRLVHNRDWEAGMGGSIGAGIGALDREIEGALIVPGDMPLLTAQLIEALAKAFNAAERARVVYPVTRAGEQRNPVLWPRRFFAALQALPPDAGAKALLQTLPACDRVAMPLEDEGPLRDIDTPEELAALAELRARR